jgi:hypothetical protein
MKALRNVELEAGATSASKQSFSGWLYHGTAEQFDGAPVGANGWVWWSDDRSWAQKFGKRVIASNFANLGLFKLPADPAAAVDALGAAGIDTSGHDWDVQESYRALSDPEFGPIMAARVDAVGYDGFSHPDDRYSEGKGTAVALTNAALVRAFQESKAMRTLRLPRDFDPDEPRDETGEWTDGGGDGGSSSGSGSGSAGKLSDKEKADLDKFGPVSKDAKGYEALRSSKEFGKALAKLPRAEGTFYRGMALSSQKEAEQFAVGKTATFDKHSFATPQQKSAKSYAQVQVLKNSKAIPIILAVKNASAANYTAHRTGGKKGPTKEVVFAMGDKIKVTSREETVINGAKGYLVTAEHVR